MAAVPPRPGVRPQAPSARPTLPAPSAVVPPQSTPAATLATPPAETAIPAPAATVASPTPTINTVASKQPVAVTNPTAAPAATTAAPDNSAAPQVQIPGAPVTTPAATEPAKAKRGRAARDLTTFWGVISYNEDGTAKMVKDKDGNETPLPAKLDTLPELFTGTEAEAKAGVLNSKVEDNGFNQEKHFALTRDDFTKPSDFERHRSRLLIQKSQWLDAEAAAIDAGTSTKGSAASVKQMADMKTVMSNLIAMLTAQGVSAEKLAETLGPVANMIPATAAPAA